MVQTFSDVAQMRGGATPQTFDGSGSLTLNERARKLVGISVSHSASARTTDEGSALIVRLQSSNWNGSRYFLMGHCFSSGPASNSSIKGAEIDFIALDIDVAPSTTISIDITEALGATQTGTHDVVIELLYSDGELPIDVKMAMVGAARCPAVKGGTYLYNAAVTAAGETACTNNNTVTSNIPAEAREIVGIGMALEADTAVTADQEHTGNFKIDYGLVEQGSQKYAFPGLLPNDGTEVDGNVPRRVSRRPIYIGNLPPRELALRGYVDLYGASTGGVGAVINPLWR